MNLQPDLSLSWKHVLRSNVKFLYLATILCLIIFWHFNLAMMLLFQHRSLSIPLLDPILHMIPPHAVSLELNLLSYTAAITALIYLAKKPRLLLIAIQALLMMWILRWLTIYLLPLATPPNKVPLPDLLAYSHYNISRDLFFSGHTATIVILLLLTKANRFMSIFMGLLLLAIVSLLLIGHQHYFLDILCAPFFAYTCYRIATKINHYAIPALLKNYKIEKSPEAKSSVITD